MADAELHEFFSPNSPLEADILGELRSILRLHNLSAQDLFFKWESYCIKMDIDAQDVSLVAIRNLKQTIQDALESSNSRKAQQVRVSATPRAAGAARGGGIGDVFGVLDGLLPNTPASSGGKLGGRGGGGSAAKQRRVDHVASSPATGGMRDQLKSMDVNGSQGATFSDRANPGEILEVLNGHLLPGEPPIAPFPESRIKLMAASDQKKMAYKPLAMKLSEASEILDDRIDEFATIVQDHHKLDDSAFGSAASQGTTEIVAVGRIASDSPEGKLNAASMVLETSRRTGNGLRVPLNLDKLRQWSFFPGQIVAFKGSNTSGQEFVVNEILEVPLLPNAASSTTAMEAHRNKLGGGPDAMDSDSDPLPLSVMFAAGPYTPDDNLDFEPLHALCSQAADTYADTLILTGPFIDIDHPLIATGDFDLPEEATYDADTATMNTVFKYLFSPALNRLTASNPHITIILVPSVRDVIDKHVSWPQDAIPRKELGLPKSARLVSNPMSLAINEVVLGISSQDVLYELRGEEVQKGMMGQDLMGRLCRYLVEQRHYFPLYPSTDRKRLPKTGTEEAVATGAVLDVSYMKLGEMVNVRPDIMVTPSALPPFAKVVESVLAINPGPLSKRRGAGTYARMTLKPLSLDDEAGVSMHSHQVFDRARVEIVRI